MLNFHYRMKTRPTFHIWVLAAMAPALLIALSSCSGTTDLLPLLEQGPARCYDSGAVCPADSGPADMPNGEGPLSFRVPYNFPPIPTEGLVRFAAVLKNMDLYILEDVSGSMKDELKSIKTNLSAMLEAVICDEGDIPEVDMCIANVETGAGEFGRGDQIRRHLKDVDANNLVLDTGPDEDSTEALLPVNAMGSNEKHLQAMAGAINGACASDAGRIGRACFRKDAISFIVLVSDEDFQEDETYAQRQVLYDQMAAMNVFVIGVTGTDAEASSLEEDLLAMSGGTPQRPLVPAIDTIPRTPQCTTFIEDPFYNNRAIVSGPDSEASSAMTCGLQAVSTNMPQDLSISIINVPENRDWRGSPVDAVSAFVDHVEVYQDPGNGCSDVPEVGEQGGYPAVFRNVVPGTEVCWKIHVKQNTVVEAAEEQSQRFFATLRIVGLGGALLRSEDILFEVPASKNPDIN